MIVLVLLGHSVFLLLLEVCLIRVRLRNDWCGGGRMSGSGVVVLVLRLWLGLRKSRRIRTAKASGGMRMGAGIRQRLGLELRL